MAIELFRGSLGARSEAIGKLRTVFREFEANSGLYSTRVHENMDQFPAAVVERPKSDSLLASLSTRANCIYCRLHPYECRRSKFQSGHLYKSKILSETRREKNFSAPQLFDQSN